MEKKGEMADEPLAVVRVLEKVFELGAPIRSEEDRDKWRFFLSACDRSRRGVDNQA